MVGLLGNANGNDLDDLVTRGGAPVTFPDTPFAELYGTYVNSWRISNAESMFDYGPGETTATFTDLTLPGPARHAGNAAAGGAVERDRDLQPVRPDHTGTARRVHRRRRPDGRRRLRHDRRRGPGERRSASRRTPVRLSSEPS